MYLYNSYCYESLDFAATSFFSKGIVDNLGVLQSYTVTSTNTVNFVYLPLGQIGKVNPTFSNFSLKFAECSSMGFDNSFFGVSITDSVLISWAVVLVLMMAYKFKIVKRMLF